MAGTAVGLDAGTRPLAGVRRIAVLRANGLGDFVLALPALEALRAAYPDALIVYLGLPWHRTLLAGRPGPWDRVDVVPPWPGVTAARDAAARDATARNATARDAAARDHDGGVRDVAGTCEQPSGKTPEQRAFVQRHRRARYDLAVQLHGGGAYSTPLLHMLNAGLTVGGRDLGAPPLDRALPFRHLQHETLRNLEIVGLVAAPPVSLVPALAVTATDRRLAADALPADAVPAEALATDPRLADRPRSPLVAVHPGAGDPRRRWPVDRFAAVADALAEDGARVVVVGGQADRDLAERLVAATRHRPLDLTGRLSRPGLVGLLAGADLMIGNDSGPRHLAAAVGIPTVGVFWCGNVITAGPLDRARHRVLTSFQNLCPECGVSQTHGRCPHDPSFVAEVETRDVVREARNLLARDWEQGAADTGEDDAPPPVFR